MGRSPWRVLTKCGPLEEGMAIHFGILALRTPWTVWKGKKIGHWKLNSLGRWVPNMLLEISGEITPERMKRWSQNKNNTQLWMWLVMEVKSDAVKTNVAWSEVKSLSRVWLFVTPWIVAYQAPPSMVFSRQEYWSGLPFHSQGELPDPGIKPRSPALQADTLPSEPPGKPNTA